MFTRTLMIVGLCCALCVCTMVALGSGEKPEAEGDFRYIVTTSIVMSRDGWRGAQSLPLSSGTNNPRVYLDNLAMDNPRGQVVVHGIFDLK